MIDTVKELLQVNVHDNCLALADVFLRLGYGLIGRASGTESVASVAERSVPLRLEYLQGRLLDEPVKCRWFTKLASSAIRFRDGYALYRAWFILTGYELFPYGGPVISR